MEARGDPLAYPMLSALLSDAFPVLDASAAMQRHAVLTYAYAYADLSAAADARRKLFAWAPGKALKEDDASIEVSWVLGLVAVSSVNAA